MAVKKKKEADLTPRVLIVDDEEDIRELLALTIKRMGLTSVQAADLAQARKYLHEETWQLCLSDMRLPDGDGLSLIEYIRTHQPNTPIVIITAHGNVEAAVNALKAGAFDFVTKPIDVKQTRALITRALQTTKQMPAVSKDDRLVGSSSSFKNVLTEAKNVARTQATVFIRGESGVGKELIARTIHRLGGRADGPFVPVNCGAIPGDLMESELFGHRRGSFTGAHEDRQGLFQTADGGSLFLDEIADLPLPMQVKLLRAIQERRIRPIGAEEEIPVDVRIISAARLPLDQLVQAGSFREDLYYRIHVIELFVPPLRDRREDIPALTDHFLNQLSNRDGVAGGRPLTLSDEAKEALLTYAYPGNVRELENILERGAALSENGIITPGDLRLPDPVPVSPSDSDGKDVLPAIEAKTGSLNSYMENVQKQALLSALEVERWNQTRAARRLGITLRALRYRLEKMGLK